MAERKPRWMDALVFLALGLEWVLATVVGYLAGSWADEKFRTEPWLMVTGVVLGNVIGFVNFYRIAKRFV